MISLDRVLTYARSQGFRVREDRKGGAVKVTLIDKRGRESVLLDNHVPGAGVSKDLEDLIRAETR